MIDLPGLMQFIPLLSPSFAEPKHLAPLIARLERALIEPLRLVVSMPPRHGKTEALLHWIVWLMLQQPELQIVYASYAQAIAERKSRRVRMLAERAGVELDPDARSRGDWRTRTDGGGLLAVGVNGQLTGDGARVIVIDDSLKDRVSAESPTIRQQTFDWLNDVAYTRLEPDGSMVVCATRWVEDDPIGRLARLAGWESISMPAISDAGEPLWPERWPLARLEEIREQLGTYGWSSLYQGRPMPRGGALFRDAKTYSALPPRMRKAIGIDCAYTVRKRADYSAAVVVGEWEGVYYVLDVIRMQSEVPVFAAALSDLLGRHPGAVVEWYTSTTEAGIAQLLTSMGVPVRARPAVADKFVRAQPVAACWAAGNVLVPEQAPWLTMFLHEVLSFTGADRHDDMVDSLAAGFDAVMVHGGSMTDEERQWLRGANERLSSGGRWGNSRGWG